MTMLTTNSMRGSLGKLVSGVNRSYPMPPPPPPPDWQPPPPPQTNSLPQQAIAERTWEVLADGTTMHLNTGMVQQRLALGNLGLFTQVRGDGEANWRRIDEVPDFAPLAPFINFNLIKNTKGYQYSGVLYLSNNIGVLISMGMNIRAKPSLSGVHFAIPLLESTFERTSIPAHGFGLWDDSIFSVIVRPPTVKAGNTLDLSIIGMNLSGTVVNKELHSYGYPLPYNEKEKLKFAIPAGTARIQRISIPIAPNLKPGNYQFDFRNNSDTDKAAKGAAVFIATLGTVKYQAGHKGFTMNFTVTT